MCRTPQRASQFVLSALKTLLSKMNGDGMFALGNVAVLFHGLEDEGADA